MSTPSDPPVDVPLCVDLDGTLTPVDTLHEALLALMKRSPLELLRLPFAVAGGKAAFKSHVVDRLTAGERALGLEIVPLHEDLVAFIKTERAGGRRTVLVTASERRVAEAIALEAGCFDEVMATERGTNLAATHKRDALVARFGEKGFDYAGNSSDDLDVWPAARRAIVVNASTSVLGRARKTGHVTQVFERRPAGLAQWLKAIRIHQWVKNLLVFLPLLLAHRIGDLAALTRTAIAFVAFGCCASSVYLLNDLLDLPSDRRHLRKRNRPFASGALPASRGLGLAGLLLFGATVLALLASPEFAAVLGIYYLTTLAYSLELKRYALVDVMLLAGLYTLRIIAGGAAAHVPASFWLLAFSLFIFLSLGIVKRYTELDLTKESPDAALHGRGYARQDMGLLLSLGGSSGFVAVLVLALYINSPESTSLYRHPKALWLLCPLLLYWVASVWLRCTRGQMHDDPIVFAIKDRASLSIGALGVLIVFLAT